MKDIIVAIDGYSACGKSTLARQLAARLNYLYLDTGAMYRALALYILEQNISWKEPSALLKIFDSVHISFHFDTLKDQYRTFLNKRDVEDNIRTMQVSNLVSEIAAVSSVRKFLVQQQRAIGAQKKIVLDGRDIGTVVFPDAELKIFVIADMEVRIQRRHTELEAAGFNVSSDDIRKNLNKRDHEETTRSDSPLKRADDAILLDTSYLSQQQQLDIALAWAHEKSGLRLKM